MGISRDDWLKALTDVSPTMQPDDPDAITVNEYCQLMGVGIPTARGHLERLVLNGKAQRAHKTLVSNYGRRLSYIAYRLIDPPKVAKKKR